MARCLFGTRTSAIIMATYATWSRNAPLLFHLSLQWRHNGLYSVSNHQPYDCLLNHLFRRRSKKPSKLRVTGLCAGNSPGTGEFPAQMASNVENVSIWWCHHAAINQCTELRSSFWCNYWWQHSCHIDDLSVTERSSRWQLCCHPGAWFKMYISSISATSLTVQERQSYNNLHSTTIAQIPITWHLHTDMIPR